MIEQVIEFNRNILGIDLRPIGPMPHSEYSHLKLALEEEAREFEESCTNGNFLGSIDALIDSVYFALGGLYKMGLTGEMVHEIFDAVHGSNMTKKRGVVARRDTGAPDAVKPVTWEPPEEKIARILDKYTGEGADT